MITGNMLVMFIIGFIIFCFYIAGLIYAIYWGHSTQRKEMENDPELRDYCDMGIAYVAQKKEDGASGEDLIENVKINLWLERFWMLLENNKLML